jgi:hypothetical protein
MTRGGCQSQAASTCGESDALNFWGNDGWHRREDRRR